jgi:histidinol-phosphate aminotransferase
VGYLNKVKAPYNINLPAQELTLKALEEVGQVNDMIQELVQLRIALAGVFEEMPIVEVVYPSDTNFLLIKIPNATKLYQFLLTKGIVVRDRSILPNCADTLRITVGTEQENTALVDAMIEWMEQQLT